MKKILLFLMALPLFSIAQEKMHVMDSQGHALNIRFDVLKWRKIVPEPGERLPEITILHVDPKTQATQLMIRVPNNIHVPMHWHSANETHTIISGTFIVECEGKGIPLVRVSSTIRLLPCITRHGQQIKKVHYFS